MRQSIETLKIPHKYSFVADHVTVSIGVKSIHYESDMTFNEIVEKVDQMLYLAKDQGRNRVMA
jgi:two-component system chemotaxis family response regulator WspR